MDGVVAEVIVGGQRLVFTGLTQTTTTLNVSNGLPSLLDDAEDDKPEAAQGEDWEKDSCQCLGQGHAGVSDHWTGHDVSR